LNLIDVKAAFKQEINFRLANVQDNIYTYIIYNFHIYFYICFHEILSWFSHIFIYMFPQNTTQI